MLLLELIMRLFSTCVIIILAVFYVSSPFYSDSLFYVAIFYIVFILLRKYIYVDSLKPWGTLTMDGVELIIILYVHGASHGHIAFGLYTSLIVRIAILYNLIPGIAFLFGSYIGFIIISGKKLFDLSGYDGVLYISYFLAVLVMLYWGVTVVKKLDEQRVRQARQLVNMVEVKQKLIEELNNSREKLRKYNEELTHLANTDGLTGLYNHKYFHEYLERLFKYSVESNARICLLMMDMDRFKKYNDTWGHQAGDELLKDVAAIFLEGSNEDDVVARYGGDEFAIILPGRGEESGKKRAESIKNAFALYKEGHPEADFVNISIGIASNTFGVNSKDELVKRADYDLYRSKKV